MDRDREIVDNLPLAVQIFDETGCLIDANTAFLEWVGADSVDALGKQNLFEDPFLDSDKIDCIKKGESLKVTKQIASYDWSPTGPSHPKDDQLLTLVKTYTPLSGPPKRYMVSTSNISNQKETEQALIENERRYRQVVEKSPMGMYFYELDGDALVFSDYNPAADRQVGVDNSQFIGKTIEEAFPPLSKTEIPKRYRAAAREGVSWSTEQVTYEDEQIAGAFEVYAFQTSPGKMAAVFMDITDRKKATEDLKNEKERISVTLRSIGDGVIATDIKGRVTLMNRAAENLTGWRFKDAMGRPLAETFNIINEQTKKPCENPVEKVLRTSSIVELENHTVLIAKDGQEVIIADSGAPIFDKESNIVGVVLVFRDITERSKMRDAMQRAQKLESLSLLAGGIAHDFNNLLGGIFGYMDLAVDITTDEHVRNYLEKAFFTLNRAKGLTQQLLTFAKGGEPVLKTAHINELAAQSAKFSLSGTNVSLNCEFPSNLWSCKLDENQIGQVIDNIVINAHQAMPLGGEVRMKARNITVTPGSHSMLPAGNYVEVSISDTGVGIPKGNLDSIFDPFFTTKKEGSGLGLATCYSIVQKHRGTIEVASEPGKGTTFRLYLPVADADAAAVTTKKKEPKKGSGKILVLDDEDFLRDILGNMLESLGYTPICVASGEEAKTVFESKKPEDQIVAAILDLTIPGGMGGKETGKAIHDIDEQVPIFVSSGYSEDPVMSNPEAYGFVASITKPFRKHEICEILCTHIHER